MLKIYSHDAYLRLLGSYPCLYVDDDGMLFTEEAYNHTFFGHSPCGKIDFANKKIYGSDYSSMFRSPVAEYIHRGSEVHIYKYPIGTFDSPFLYVKDNKIYTAEEFQKSFGSTPSGYIESIPNPVSGGGNTNGSNNGGNGNGVDSGGGAGCSLPFWAILVGALALWYIARILKFMFFDMIGMGGFVVTGILFPILTAKIGPVTYLEKTHPAVAQCKSKAKSSAALVAVICGALWVVTDVRWFTKSGGRMDLLLLLLAISVGFTTVSFFVAKQYFYRKYLTESAGNANVDKHSTVNTKDNVDRRSAVNNKDNVDRRSAVNNKDNVDRRSAVNNKDNESINDFFSTKGIVRCPHCGAKCRVSMGKGYSTVVCPNPKCQKPFDINT